jgi:hypothetical protein
MVNSVYYNTRAVASYVDYLLVRDPSAIIVVMSDHQGALPSVDRSSDWSNVFALERFRTPYIFIDAGEVLRPGDIAHFDIPHMILSSLRDAEWTPITKSYGCDWIRPIGQRSFYGLNDEVFTSPSEVDPQVSLVRAFRAQALKQWLRLISDSRRGGR